MGVDRKLFVNAMWDVENIKDLLETVPEVSKLTIEQTHTPSYVILFFVYDGPEEKEKRQMNFHYNTQSGGFQGNLMSLGAWGSSDKILKTIAERIGGFYTHEDTRGVIEEYAYPAAENLDFMLKYTIIRGKCDGRTLEQFVKDHNSITEGWEEKRDKKSLLLGKKK